MIKKYQIAIFFFSILIGCERPTSTDQDDGIPPAVPANVSIYSATDGEIIIEWKRNNEPAMKGYNIYRKSDSTGYKEVTFTTDDFYIDDSLEYDDTFYYKISAEDVWGRESMTSGEISAVPINRFPPVRPRFLEINGRNWEGEISISLNWAGNFETDLSGYNIYRGVQASFIADQSSFVGFSEFPFFNDTSALLLYTNYYYKVKAVDKGGMLSPESSEIYDRIFGAAELIFPGENQQVNYFEHFLVKAIEEPAQYKIIVQTNQFFGEFWSKDFSSSIVNDTILIEFDPPFIDVNKKYYWRVLTFSGNSTEPNSVSELHSFIIKQ
jgi:hypothetical protein